MLSLVNECHLTVILWLLIIMFVCKIFVVMSRNTLEDPTDQMDSSVKYSFTLGSWAELVRKSVLFVCLCFVADQIFAVIGRNTSEDPVKYSFTHGFWAELVENLFYLCWCFFCCLPFYLLWWAVTLQKSQPINWFFSEIFLHAWLLSLTLLDNPFSLFALVWLLV